MKRLILTIIISIIASSFNNLIYSQTYIKPMLMGLGDELTSCDDTVQIVGFNMPTNGNFQYNGQSYANNSITNSYCNESTSFQFDLYKELNMDTTYYAHSSLVYPKFNFDVIGYIAPSSIYSQDGEMVIYFDSIMDINEITASTICELDTANLSDFYVSPQVVKRIEVISTDGHTFTLRNLRMGQLFININQGILPSDKFETVMYLGEPDSTLFLNCGIYAYLVHRLISGPNCASVLSIEPQEFYDTGSPFTVTYTVQGPSAADFNYYTSNQSLFSLIICPGVYTIQMESSDISGWGGQQEYSFVQLDPDLTYFDVSVSSAFQDSIGLYYKDCNFDFTAAITSIDFDYVIIGSDPNGVNIYSTDLTVMQNSIETHFFDTLVVADIETYKLVIGIYCDELKGQNSFMHQGIALIPNMSLSVTDLGYEEINYFPNPASDILQFSKEFKGAIFDSRGRKCKEFQDKKVEISDLPNGVYLIQVENHPRIMKLIVEH